MSVALPPTHRTRDSLYVLFFMSYIPIVLFVDSIPLYPRSIVPASLLSLHEWYKDHFNDQLVITQPAWFRFFALSEPLYQLPVAAWGIWALRSKSYKALPHLLVWGLVCCGTTLTCLFEFYHNTAMSDNEKLVLSAMYGSYAVIFGVIAADMFCRIQTILGAAARLGEDKKLR
ncbi:putative membrane [Lyophyllum shimeji]|uniref:Efficient mitochondria targeting-associated protein 19 n=1 Tax=Lyophyllum shimeji TaxID=47721 RepID=A0A9P3UPZ5_LYOSH|nr:putative membrane [Lyophyllum shimeji]